MNDIHRLLAGVEERLRWLEQKQAANQVKIDELETENVELQRVWMTLVGYQQDLERQSWLA
jgi:hypothetical protein